MSREARKHSGTGIYHVMLRGINRQDIFEDDDDPPERRRPSGMRKEGYGGYAPSLGMKMLVAFLGCQNRLLRSSK